jgi:hypothetical protein
VQARLRYASKFAADIPVADYTHAATVVLDNVIVTYAHDDHAAWQIGERKQVCWTTVQVHHIRCWHDLPLVHVSLVGSCGGNGCCLA